MKNSVLFKEMNDHEYTQCLKTLKAAEKKYKKDALPVVETSPICCMNLIKMQGLD